MIFIIHIWLTIQLKLENHAAREPYVFKNTIKATLSSRYMIYTGLTILVFLIYHLYQYTLRVGTIPPSTPPSFPTARWKPLTCTR